MRKEKVSPLVVITMTSIKTMRNKKIMMMRARRRIIIRRSR
jgi:hypothetical protein